jgi:hypothetical protein
MSLLACGRPSFFCTVMLKPMFADTESGHNLAESANLKLSFAVFFGQ